MSELNDEYLVKAPDATKAREWPACATYPNLGCLCRGSLGQNKSTCTRKRTGDLTPILDVRQLPDKGN